MARLAPTARDTPNATGKKNNAIGKQTSTIDPVALRSIGLHYIDDSVPGIKRRKVGKQFRYFYADGQPLRDAGEIARIRALAIPPAYTDVWIAPIANGYLQATARDARGRKQYRYHPQWRLWRDATKYHRVLAFGKALPKIRRRVQRDLQREGLCREKVLATVVRLLEVTLIRVGNEEYARTNQSFGLTTLRDKHVSISGSRALFHFRGKSGQVHEIALSDKKLASIVKRCRDLPGQELFQYVDDEGNRHPIHSNDVNDYLREISGEDFTAKDFRTWAGTVLTAAALHEIETFNSQAQYCTGDRIGGMPARQHTGNLPTLLCSSRGDRGVLRQNIIAAIATRRSPFAGAFPTRLTKTRNSCRRITAWTLTQNA